MTGSACTNGVCDKYPNISWRYYSPTPNGIIWNAPEAIPEVCYGENDLNFVGQPCGSINGGTEWNDHMTFYSSFSNTPIFTDISSCNLANISWVIPDQALQLELSLSSKESVGMWVYLRFPRAIDGGVGIHRNQIKRAILRLYLWCLRHDRNTHMPKFKLPICP
jgi:hypothetical protein